MGYNLLVSLALPNMFHIDNGDFHVANSAQLQHREGYRNCTCHDGLRLAVQNRLLHFDRFARDQVGTSVALWLA